MSVKDESLDQPHAVAAELARLYPDASCALVHKNPYELLVATILSAQTTDERVNTVTPELFEKYPTPLAMAQADVEDIARTVRRSGFKPQVEAVAEDGAGLVEKFDSQVPMGAIESLPGVGRKTAHVIMGNAFGIPAITVDTHVGRLAKRLGWTTGGTPLAREKDIAKALPDEDWTILSHRLIEHGRGVCHSQNPECANCALADLCPSAEVD